MFGTTASIWIIFGQVSFSFDLAWRLTRLPDKTWMMHIEGEWIHQMPGVVFLKLWEAEQVEVLFFSSKKCCEVQLFLRYLPVDYEYITVYSLPKSSIRTWSARAHIRTHGVWNMRRCETSICWPKLMQDLSTWLLDLVHQSFRCPSVASSHYWSRQARCPPKLLWACRKGWLQLLLYAWVHPWWWGSDVCPPCWVWFWEWHLVTMWFS